MLGDPRTVSKETLVRSEGLAKIIAIDLPFSGRLSVLPDFSIAFVSLARSRICMSSSREKSSRCRKCFGSPGLFFRSGVADAMGTVAVACTL